MKKFLLIVMCLVILSPVVAKAEIGPWKMYVVFLKEANTSVVAYDWDTANRVLNVVKDRFTAEPGHIGQVYAAWVADGRIGETTNEWFYSYVTPWVLYEPFVPFDPSPQIALSIEDTDYVVSYYYDPHWGRETMYVLITNRVHNYMPTHFLEYCDLPPLDDDPTEPCPEE